MVECQASERLLAGEGGSESRFSVHEGGAFTSLLGVVPGPPV